MEHGEAISLGRYFNRQLNENRSYYFATQLDCEELITNIFWADARMIIDYSHFSDVIMFDTTYSTNRDARPLGVFLGLNHHRETVVFGGALLYDETIESFVWLFETFLEAMFEKKPITIFTDQDAAMSIVIKVVMPKTYHIGQLLLPEVSSRRLDLMGSGAYSHLCYWAFIETLIFYNFSLFF